MSLAEPNRHVNRPSTAVFTWRPSQVLKRVKIGFNSAQRRIYSHFDLKFRLKLAVTFFLLFLCYSRRNNNFKHYSHMMCYFSIHIFIIKYRINKNTIGTGIDSNSCMPYDLWLPLATISKFFSAFQGILPSFRFITVYYLLVRNKRTNLTN